VIIDLPAPIAVVCHDAGAANHVVAWLSSQGPIDNIQVYMEGPASKIWNAAFPGHIMKSSVTEVLVGVRSLLSGTGWASDLEYESRRLACQAGLKTVAMVDHWVNYKSRFIRKGLRILPDEIWVVDDCAFQIASASFDKCAIRLKPDLYSQSLVESLQPISEISHNVLLYLLEPMRTDWGRGLPGEFQSLDFMLDHLELLKLPEDTIIRLRPHPSDPPNKYDQYLTHVYSRPIDLDQSVSLRVAMSSSRWVAGCESFALTLALKANRTVFCTLPPWAPPCRLPHADLVHLKNL
jgi:hypothetical protein